MKGAVSAVRARTIASEPAIAWITGAAFVLFIRGSRSAKYCREIATNPFLFALHALNRRPLGQFRNVRFSSLRGQFVCQCGDFRWIIVVAIRQGPAETPPF
jgi:hypothetical protein